MWARAMYTYDKVAKNIGPKKEALAQAEGELAVVQSELGKKQGALRKVGEGGGCRSDACLVLLLRFDCMHVCLYREKHAFVARIDPDAG